MASGNTDWGKIIVGWLVILFGVWFVPLIFGIPIMILGCYIMTKSNK